MSDPIKNKLNKILGDLKKNIKSNKMYNKNIENEINRTNWDILNKKLFNMNTKDVTNFLEKRVDQLEVELKKVNVKSEKYLEEIENKLQNFRYNIYGKSKEEIDKKNQKEEFLLINERRIEEKEDSLLKKINKKILNVFSYIYRKSGIKAFVIKNKLNKTLNKLRKNMKASGVYNENMENEINRTNWDIVDKKLFNMNTKDVTNFLEKRIDQLEIELKEVDMKSEKYLEEIENKLQNFRYNIYDKSKEEIDKKNQKEEILLINKIEMKAQDHTKSPETQDRKFENYLQKQPIKMKSNFANQSRVSVVKNQEKTANIGILR